MSDDLYFVNLLFCENSISLQVFLIIWDRNMAEISVDIHRTSYKGGKFLNKRWCYVGESNKVILVLSTTLIMLIG